MFKKSLLLTLLLALLVPWAANAQVVPIGNGSSEQYYVPIDIYYKYSLVQMVYTADEIAAGSPTTNTILSVGFDHVGSQSKTYGITVYMKNVTYDEFSTTSFELLSDADIVYSGNIKPENGWTTIELDSPFTYDDTKNLLIAINKTSGGYVTSNHKWHCTTTTGKYTSLHVQRDNNPSEPYDPTTANTGTRETYRANVQLTFGTPPTCFAPQNLTCTSYTTTTATLEWQRHTSGTETAWVLQYSPDNTFTTGVQSVNVNTTPSRELPDLTAEQTYYARVRPDCDENLWSDVCEFKPSATQIIPIGDGTNANYYLPVNTYYNYSLTQQIYTATEIQTAGGSAGTINSISFYHDYANTTPKTMNGIKAYLLNTDKDAFTSSTDMVAVTDADKVWEGNITLDGAGWVTIDFTTPFDYDGGNLIVCMYYPTKEYPGNSYKFRYTATTYYSSVYYYDDDDTDIPDLNNINTYGGSKAYQQYHNNIQIGIVPTNTPKPKNLHVVDNTLSSSGATLAWDAPATATPVCYLYNFKKTTDAYWGAEGTVSTGTSVALTLEAGTEYMFRVKADYGTTGQSGYIETSFTTLDDCAFPTNLVATTTPGQGAKATLTWVKGYDEEAWVLEYATNNTFTEGLVEVTEGFTTEGNNVTYNATGLTAETKYYARVKATCSATSSSTWSSTVEFTPTNYVDFHYNETATSNGSYVPFRPANVKDATNQSQFIIPAASLADVAGGKIRSITYYTSSTATIDLGNVVFDVYMTEVEQAAFSASTFIDWTTLGTPVFSGNVTLANQKMTVTFDNDYSYNGGNLLIGFKTNTAGTTPTTPTSFSWVSTYISTSYTQVYQYGTNDANRTYYQPKVTLNYRPTSTPRPIITEPVATTDVTATIAWTKPSDNVTGYKYQYKLASATEWPTNWTDLNDANAVSVTVPNLTPNTSYDFQMKAVYAEGESVASSTSFATTCPAATAVPYSYGFETAPEFNCWEVTSSVSNGVKRANSYAHEGSYSLVFYGTQLNEIEMPLFNQPTNTLRLEYWVRPEGYKDSRSGSFAIGYYNANNEFVALKTYTFNTTTGQYDDWESTTYIKQRIEFNVDANNDGTPDVPADAHIVFRQFNPTSNYYWMVDDVKVKVIPTCEDVNDVHYVSFTNHSATIAWTADAGQTAWQIAYKAGANFNPNDDTELATATVVDVTANPYLFDQTLNAETTYYMYVRGNCTASSNGYGDWSDSYATFTTLSATPAPSNFTASNIDKQTADLVWTAGGGDYESSWELYYVASENAPEAPIATTEATKIVNALPTNENPYTLDGLTASTKYYIWVRANHGSDGPSDWTALTGAYFETLESCPAPTGLAASEVTNHTAKLSWTGTSESYVLSVGTYDYTATPITGTITEEGFESTSMPTGWTHIGSGSAVTTTNDYHEGSRSLYFSGATSNNVVVLPDFGVETNELTISFWSKAEGSSSGEFDFGYVTNATDASTFVQLEYYTNIQHSSFTQVKDYSMASVPDGARIAFRHRSGSTNWFWFIDDVTITGPVYPIAYTEYNTSDMYKTVEDLAASTIYFAKVKGNCGSEGYSQETTVISFETDIACPAPTALTASNPTSMSFDLQWTNGGAENWVLAYKKTGDDVFTEIDLTSSDVLIEGNLITYTLSGLDAEQEYTVKVRDNCEPSYTGDGVSEWTAELTYSTIPACSAINPVVSNITHHNATVNWEGESASGYTVNYRTAARISSENPLLKEEFNTNSATPPTGWTRYRGLVDNVIAGTATLTTVTNGWYTNSTHALGSYNAILNIYGSSINHWLVSPEVTLTDGMALIFDLALTDYSFATPIEYPELQLDDRFVVLVFADDAWHILREWNNSGSEYVYNTIATAGENALIDLSTYNGKTVKIAFYGESTIAGASSGVEDNDIHIDNIMIGTAVAAGAWQTQAAATTTADLTGLTAGTLYDVKVVPNCDPTSESETKQFHTIASNIKHFLTAGDWGTASNWLDEEIPAITDNAILHANVIINNGTVATTDNITFEGSPTPTLTINDGGQLKHNNTSSINATVKKTINGYGSEQFSTNKGYVLFAPPFSKSIYQSNSDGSGLRNGTYDLYSWNRTSALEWTNYGSNNSSSLSMSRGTGYLYASQDDRELTFTGNIYGSGIEYSKSVSYTAPGGSTEYADFNLIGNPFVCDAYLADDGGTPLAYYKMNDAGDDFETVTGEAIAPMQGVFYQATADGNVYFYRELPSTSVMPGTLNIQVAQVVNSRDARRSTDNAIIRFGEGNTLEKFSFNADNAKIYIPQGGKDYAVANAENAGEMPVYFKAAENGSYTVDFTARDVEFSYLHLIDNMTGNDVNLLETPSYSFDARTIDYASRFKLVFATGLADMGDDFGFFDANGNLAILGIEGTATLQVIDVTGRTLSSETFSGNYCKAVNAKAGVYMLRLIQGNDVRTQKIVVK